MSTYILIADITDQILIDFGTAPLQAKLDLSDKAVEDLAERKGLEVNEIETSPVHHQLKRWNKYWVGKELCFDAMFKNNVEIDASLEKYKLKFDEYKLRLQETETEITRKMISGDVVDQRDRVGLSTGTLYRT